MTAIELKLDYFKIYDVENRQVQGDVLLQGQFDPRAQRMRLALLDFFANQAKLKRAKLEKRVIFIVTDGEDNASTESLEQTIRRLQADNGPTVYTIGILGDEEHPKRARRALQLMADRTGGIAFFPKTLDEVDAISRSVAHDIRNQYTIGYKPSTPKNQGGYRQVKVDAHSRGYGKLTVRTKSGYYAGAEPAAGAQ